MWPTVLLLIVEFDNWQLHFDGMLKDSFVKHLTIKLEKILEQLKHKSWPSPFINAYSFTMLLAFKRFLKTKIVFFLKFLLDDFLIVSDKRERFVSIVLILYTIKTLLNRRDQHIVSCTHRTLESTQTSCHRKSLISPLVFSGGFFQLLKARKSINVIH